MSISKHKNDLPMKSHNFFTNSAIVTAVLASLCCITPVLAVLAGLGGIATTFSFLDPLRPFFIGFTVIVLGLAFYNAYKPKKQNEIDCACETDENGSKKGFVNSKAFLWIVALVAITLVAFPYYSKLFFPKNLVSEAVAEVPQGQIANVQLHIEGMTCTGCEQSVNYALQSTPGVVSVESSYKTGIANVQFDKTKTAPDQLKQAVEKKVGYKVTDIQNIETKE